MLASKFNGLTLMSTLQYINYTSKEVNTVRNFKIKNQFLYRLYNPYFILQMWKLRLRKVK